jgi:hypothetical protein
MMRQIWVLLLTVLLMMGTAACGSEPANNEGGFNFNDDTTFEREDAGSVDVVEDVFEVEEEEGCSSDGECAAGMTCQPTPGETFDTCQIEPEPIGLDDGEACSTESDCEGGTCIPHPDWPDGYCTTLGCETRADCATEDTQVDNRCLQGRRYNLCVRMCSSSDECRDGYSCHPVGGGQGFCAPGGGGQASDADPGLENPEEYPFAITCGLTHDAGDIAIDYDIAEDTTSYMITPMARDGRDLTPRQISLPDGTSISFGGENRFQTIPAQLFGFINPILTPVIDAFADQLQSGAHTLDVRTDSEDLCYYVLEESTPGTTIDFNVYLVGVPGIDAAAAAEDPDMQETLQWFENIYAQAGIELDDVDFHDVTGDDAEAYQVIRTEGDLQYLVSLSEIPEGGYDDALSANIFFVQSMQLGGGGGGGGAIGISEGLPGAAGLHGTPSSGVVFTSEYMGQRFQDRDGSMVDGNKFTGIVMAHEVGHYLGLFHTSEQYGQGFDPLADTPECTSNFPNGCPDIDNLMFPLAGVSHTELSDGQIHTIKANPLTKD